MSQIRSTVPRLLGEQDHIAIHPLIGLRIPETVHPLIEANCADLDDAEPRLSALFPLRRLERLTIATCQDENCKCCTDGGLPSTSGEPFTVGSIPLSRDCRAHLNSSEREALSHLTQAVIQNITRTMINGSYYRDTAIVPIEIDPAAIDHDPHGTTVDCDVTTRQSARKTCPSRQARIIVEPTHFPARLQGRDASHRTRSLDTHLTHGCIQHFCGFDAMRIASGQTGGHGNGAIPPFRAMANSISTVAVR